MGIIREGGDWGESGCNGLQVWGVNPQRVAGLWGSKVKRDAPLIGREVQWVAGLEDGEWARGKPLRWLE